MLIYFIKDSEGRIIEACASRVYAERVQKEYAEKGIRVDIVESE